MGDWTTLGFSPIEKQLRVAMTNTQWGIFTALSGTITGTLRTQKKQFLPILSISIGRILPASRYLPIEPEEHSGSANFKFSAYLPVHSPRKEIRDNTHSIRRTLARLNQSLANHRAHNSSQSATKYLDCLLASTEPP